MSLQRTIVPMIVIVLLAAALAPGKLPRATSLDGTIDVGTVPNGVPLDATIDGLATFHPPEPMLPGPDQRPERGPKRP
jgi:hypothetical protein